MANKIILETESLSKHWGGIKALNDISLQFHDKQLHGVVGPNGAGKSTLLNMLCGALKPSSGCIFHNGEQIEGMKPWNFVRRGIGRSFQKTNIYADITCLENCAIATQRRFTGSFNLFASRHSNKMVTEAAEKALHQVGLSKRISSIAAEISYGEQRQLELAMVLATDPCVLLLDEPMAGMGHEESLRIIELLNELKKSYSIVLVEHDMDAIFELSDQLTVLDNGTHLITGTVDEVRNEPRVKEAYLGKEEEETA
ncbi:ABC transporter ATP-binding protein [Marinobacter psychrophilus]|jgi:branched-chain amino acid transport system ATP-binding protein|uniref:ABC transporter ATP-binding protein n=1 Tax=Marinobacter psychrophilus TaxID=330734 RepID=UPI001B657DC8|nr:ABC transporter ATP-binding protein [Marinobacter psychrophilus]MBQ0763277.1 ABC transporter ATP-binding protein [Marinobacter psychrophilus]MBQ0844345.1 ABC transporter ATP-binding protein [Marinobacter psychrophilus]